MLVLDDSQRCPARPGVMPAGVPFDQFPGLGCSLATLERHESHIKTLFSNSKAGLLRCQGTDDYPGFPADGSPDLPDLSRWQLLSLSISWSIWEPGIAAFALMF